jgi:hypothetical protein
VWNNEDVCWWFSQNALLYAQRDVIAANPQLMAARKRTSEAQLSLVHPRRFMGESGGQQRTETAKPVRRLYRRLRKRVRDARR